MCVCFCFLWREREREILFKIIPIKLQTLGVVLKHVSVASLDLKIPSIASVAINKEVCRKDN